MAGKKAKKAKKQKKTGSRFIMVKSKAGAKSKAASKAKKHSSVLIKKFKEGASSYAAKLKQDVHYEKDSVLMADEPKDFVDEKPVYPSKKSKGGWFAGALGILCAILSILLIKWVLLFGLASMLLGWLAKVWGSKRLGRLSIILGIVLMLLGMYLLYFGR